MIKKFLPIILAATLWAGLGFAQVATPTLDPLQHSMVAAANSWRYGSAFGLESYHGRQEPGGTHPTVQTLGQAMNFAWQPRHFIMEVSYRPDNLSYAWNETDDSMTEIRTTSQNMNWSVRGAGRFSVGIKMGTEAITRGLDNLRDRRVYGGSFGMRAFGHVFFAMGMDSLKEKTAGYGDKRWQRSMAGVAYMKGDPMVSQFRIEYDVIQDSGVTDGVDYFDSVHPYQETLASMEFLYKEYYFGLKLQSKTETKILAESFDRLTDSLEYGLGWRKGTFFTALYRTDAKERVGTEELKYLRARLTLGWNFF